ncbi:MAG TPA: hypothetical protein EYH56_00080 [Nanoarchaeota archaeon]|nr:hypothetical protein [Nanoarchaeota archaeon]
MWYSALDYLKKQLETALEVKTFIGIKRPPNTKDYPFIALTPVEFYETEDKKIMKVSMPFGIVSKSNDPAEGTHELLNFLSKIEKILDNNQRFEHFQIEEEKFSIHDLNIREPYYSMEFIFLISAPKLPPALEE